MFSQLFQVSTYANHDYLSINICFFPFTACLQDYADGLLWPTSAQNRVITQSCSALHPSFRSRVTISRKCNDDGTWGPVDYSSCTAHNTAIPTLIISFEVNLPQVDAQHLVYNVSFQYTCTLVHCSISLFLKCGYVLIIVPLF